MPRVSYMHATVGPGVERDHVFDVDGATEYHRQPNKQHDNVHVTTLVPAEGAILAHILDTTDARKHQGLSRHASHTFDSANRRIDWARRYHQRIALMSGSDVLASAEQYHL